MKGGEKMRDLYDEIKEYAKRIYSITPIEYIQTVSDKELAGFMRLYIFEYATDEEQRLANERRR